jgi:hypothetical protein
MLRRIVGLSIAVPAAPLLWFAAMANDAWFQRHVVLPAYRLPPPAWTLPALRIGAIALGLGLIACAVTAGRRATAGGVARGAIALVLSVCACELVLRLLQRPEAEMPNPRLEWILGVPDARTGWAFVPNRTMDLPRRGRQRLARYAIDAHGDRAPTQDWVEDPQAPTILITGESTAVGHGLQWHETFAAQLAEKLHVQVVNVAEGGYGSDQAHLRAVDALPRFAHLLAVVSLVLPAQLHRNIQDDRSRLVVRDGALVIERASRSPFRLRQVFVDEIPYLSEADLQRSLRLTRTILRATAAAARARGAWPLFVVPSIGPPRPPDAHPEAFIVRALLDDLPHVIVDIDPAHLIPWDGHPDRIAAGQIADAIAAALAPLLARGDGVGDSCQVSRGCSHSASRPGLAAFPAGPRGGPCVTRGNSSPLAAREIAARESRATAFARRVQTHAISRVAAENASGPGLTVELLQRCEPRRQVRLPLAAMRGFGFGSGV